jgi:tetratricopeptide (TPR) repeat protein
MNLPVSSQSEIIKLVGQANKRDFMLFLGAGTSVSSGVPAAGVMIREWRRALYEQNVPGGAAKLAGLNDDASCKIVEDHAMKAHVLAQRGLLTEATDELKQAVSLNTDNAILRATLAYQLVSMGQLDSAGSEYEFAIRLDPQNLNYRLQVTNFYWMRQQPQAARQHLEAAVAIEPGSAEVREWLGQVYLVLGLFGEAQREMEETLRLSPNDARALGNLGLLHAQMNRPDQAEKCWRQAVAVNSSLPHPHVFLAQMYFMQNRVAELNAEIQALSRIAPAMANQLGMQLQSMRGQPASAMAAMQTQWAAMLHGAQANPQKEWPNPSFSGSGQGASFADIVRAAINKITQ